MYTYEVWVRSQKYHGRKPLTYTSVDKLAPGTIVSVALRQDKVLGIVRREAAAPKAVAMKPIEDVLCDGKFLPSEHLQLFSWLLQYYPSGSGAIAQLFLPPSLPKKVSLENPQQESHTQPDLPALTAPQSKALRTMLDITGTYVLHGVTGSGKTRLYAELIADALSRKRSALVLVPEIGLAPHITKEIETIFGKSNVTVIHSGLTVATRRNTWQRLLVNSQPHIVIGPRSALFSPLKNIGLIIADECHDDSYKQENSPHYHALRVAAQLARFHEATFIMGSATPSVSDYYIASQKDIPIIRLNKPALPSDNPVQHIIVNKKEHSEFTRSEFLSTTLLSHITQQLEKGQQTLLFLNRRGSARVIACNQCGWRALCPSCELPLTLHQDSFSMRCHTCGYHADVSTSCPQCGNHEIIFFGPGTKAIEKEVGKLFVGAKVARFDSDNLTHERLEKHLEAIKQGDIDIIIGTQILIKGFDFKRLGLVGIVDADSSLSFPDFTTEEKTYQIINQAIGRVGRGHTDGTVIVQTLRPESPLLQQALQGDWKAFYTDQIATRKLHKFPPFSFLLKIETSRKRQQSVISAAQKLKEQLQKDYSDVAVLGPTPSFKEKQAGGYTWQLIIKSQRRSRLLAIIDSLPSGWKHDIDPIHLL